MRRSSQKPQPPYCQPLSSVFSSTTMHQSHCALSQTRTQRTNGQTSSSTSQGSQQPMHVTGCLAVASGPGTMCLTSGPSRSSHCITFPYASVLGRPAGSSFPLLPCWVEDHVGYSRGPCLVAQGGRSVKAHSGGYHGPLEQGLPPEAAEEASVFPDARGFFLFVGSARSRHH